MPHPNKRTLLTISILVMLIAGLFVFYPQTTAETVTNPAANSIERKQTPVFNWTNTSQDLTLDLQRIPDIGDMVIIFWSRLKETTGAPFVGTAEISAYGGYTWSTAAAGGGGYGDESWMTGYAFAKVITPINTTQITLTKSQGTGDVAYFAAVASVYSGLNGTRDRQSALGDDMTEPFPRTVTVGTVTTRAANELVVGALFDYGALVLMGTGGGSVSAHSAYVDMQTPEDFNVFAPASNYGTFSVYAFEKTLTSIQTASATVEPMADTVSWNSYLLSFYAETPPASSIQKVQQATPVYKTETTGELTLTFDTPLTAGNVVIASFESVIAGTSPIISDWGGGVIDPSVSFHSTGITWYSLVKTATTKAKTIIAAGIVGANPSTTITMNTTLVSGSVTWASMGLYASEYSGLDQRYLVNNETTKYWLISSSNLYAPSSNRSTVEIGNFFGDDLQTVVPIDTAENTSTQHDVVNNSLVVGLASVYGGDFMSATNSYATQGGSQQNGLSIVELEKVFTTYAQTETLVRWTGSNTSQTNTAYQLAVCLPGINQEPMTSVSSITVTPSSSSIAAGASKVFSAVAYDGYGNSLTVTATAAWGINASAAGSWNQATGTYTAAKAGTWIVTATYNSTTGTATLTVTAGSLDHLSVSPALSTVVTGQNKTYSATGYDAYNNSLGAESPTWSTSEEAGGTWSTATFITENVGVWTVTATSGAIHGSAFITVYNYSVTLTPSTTTPVNQGSQVTFNVVVSNGINNITSYNLNITKDGQPFLSNFNGTSFADTNAVAGVKTYAISGLYDSTVELSAAPTATTTASWTSVSDPNPNPNATPTPTPLPTGGPIILPTTTPSPNPIIEKGNNILRVLSEHWLIVTGLIAALVVGIVLIAKKK